MVLRCLMSVRKGEPHRVRLALSSAAALLLWSQAPADVPLKHSVTLSDLETLVSPEITMSLSSDGRLLAYALGSDGLWIVKTRHGATPRQIERGFLPSWSPTEARLAYYSITSDGIQLRVFELDTGRTTQVTHLAGGIDPDPTSRIAGQVHEAFRYGWSPDGKKLVFASRVALPNDVVSGSESADVDPLRPDKAAFPLVLTRTTPADWTLRGIFVHSAESAELVQSTDGHTVTIRTDGRRGARFSSQLFVADIKGTAETNLTQGEASYFSPTWSPDGKAVLCASTGQAGSVLGSQSINLYSIDVASGQESPLTWGAGVKSRAAWSRDGKRVGYLGSISFYSQNSVYIRNLDKTDFVDATRSLDRHVERFAWNPDGKSIVVTYKDGVSTSFAQIALTSAAVKQIAGADQGTPYSVGEIAISQSGAMAWQQSDAKNPGSILFWRGDHTSPFVLVDLYPQVRLWKLGKAEIVHWKSARGEPMEGTLLMPPNYQGDGKYPLIVDAYPLMNGSNWYDPMFGNQAWASNGYAVFRPSPRAPLAWINPWKSASSSAVARGAHGWDVAVDDVVSGVDTLIQEGRVDPKRMCLYGFSNGGGVVNYLVTRTQVFKCAVSVAGALSDWIRPSLLNSDSAAWLAEWAGSSLYENPASYVELSAVFGLNKVHTPMLLADGDEDGDFLLNSIEMYSGLRRNNVDVTLLRYADQAHGFSGSALRDFWAREMKFFARHLNN
jgi:dipeptidyl aminopeptidase/acylaminoacyl peptidase